VGLGWLWLDEAFLVSEMLCEWLWSFLRVGKISHFSIEGKSFIIMGHLIILVVEI
jgi:hypothetical protein